MGWSAQRKLITTIAGGLFIFAAMIFFIINPLVGDLSNLHKMTQEQKNALADLILEESSFKAARVNFSKIEDRAAEIDSLFPVREELVGHVESLEETAKKYQDQFTLSITDPAEKAPVKKSSAKAKEDEYVIVPGLKKVEVIPYNFRLEGTFLGVVNFLQTLENQPFYSEIETLTLKSQQKSAGGGGTNTSRTGKVQADILSAFYAKR
ncbi:MAG: hypothetical protein AAB871_00345 [Patescibacteria group bacterium]